VFLRRKGSSQYVSSEYNKHWLVGWLFWRYVDLLLYLLANRTRTPLPHKKTVTMTSDVDAACRRRMGVRSDQSRSAPSIYVIPNGQTSRLEFRSGEFPPFLSLLLATMAASRRCERTVNSYT